MKFLQVLAVTFLAFLLVVGANKDMKDHAVGQSFYLPDRDIYDPHLGGVYIFKKFDDSCYKWLKQHVTVDDRSAFEDTNSFYKKISSDAGLSVKLTGTYTMGTTLNVKTASMSSGTVDIKGTTLDVRTYANVTYLDQNCFKSLKSELTDDVIKVFDNLPLDIYKPWLQGSWRHYKTFLQTFGSHFVIKSFLGAIVRQWTFSKSTSHYTNKQLQIRACVDFAGPTEIGELNFGPCIGVTKDDAESVAYLKTSNYMEIRGGSDETRHRFRNSRSQKDLDQLLNEGREMQIPVSYEYMSIWEILMMKFHDDSTRFAKAMNLMNYYYGFKDFGCSYQSAGSRQLRTFNYSPDSTQQSPTFHCSLINRGCHDDNDCHSGGVGSYCYGNSCYEYKDPAFGFKAKSVVTRTEKSGSYNEGINKSCYYTSPFSANCNINRFEELVIWDGEDLVKLASYTRTLYVSQAALQHKFKGRVAL